MVKSGFKVILGLRHAEKRRLVAPRRSVITVDWFRWVFLGWLAPLRILAQALRRPLQWIVVQGDGFHWLVVLDEGLGCLAVVINRPQKLHGGNLNLSS